MRKGVGERLVLAGLVASLGLGCTASQGTPPGPESNAGGAAPPPAPANPSAVQPSTSGATTSAPVAPVTSQTQPTTGTGQPAPIQEPTASPPTTGGAAAPAGQDAPLANDTPATSPNAQAGGTSDVPQEGAAPAMDECGLDTGYPGDEYCILPPPPDKGFQLHIGPSNYDNPEAKYILQPGQEITNNFSAVSGNTQPRHFYYRQFRQRPGAHHNIITASGGGSALGGLGGGSDFGLGHRIGTTNHLVEDSPKGGLIAPENEGVGIPIAANANINVSWHAINTSQQPLLREMWVNFWYVDEVVEEAEPLFAIGSATFSIPPGTETVLGPYSCEIESDGRMLWFYGHRHASNVRFSAWRVRGGQRDLFYEGLDWEEPLVLEYSSNVMNPVPDLANDQEGGWSGILDFQAGDRIEWECHVINQQSTTLRFSNNTYSGEMCIMDGEFVGTNCRETGGLTGGLGGFGF